MALPTRKKPMRQCARETYKAAMILHALTIFVSAFLLFLVQPIIAKQILPWFGGTAAVWSTCLVFFQLALLTGYFYSDWTTRKLTVRHQAILHVSLIAVALLLLPIVPDAAWKPKGDEEPSFQILLLLAATIGLPYFLLSTTSPLIQAWFARANPGQSPYRLFALSNLASMLALLGYPFLVEPNITTRDQAIFWSVGFGLFALLIGFAAWRSLSGQARAPSTGIDASPAPVPTLANKLIWVALAALGSIMLLAVSSHLTQNISSIPLLWVVPLALYLLTFILCFDAKDGGSGWYRRPIFMPLAALAVCAMAWMMADKAVQYMLMPQIGVFSGGLFITCMYCHGELAARKPAPQHLTTFYLMISIGGAVGSMLVGILAPLTLPAYYELGAALFALAVLGTFLLWRQYHRAWLLLGGSVALFTLSAAVYSDVEFRKDVVVMTRNFYGSLRVRQVDGATTEDQAKGKHYFKRMLVHGSILHGNQYLFAPYNRTATTYYGPKSGIGLAILQKEKNLNRPSRIGIVGLGTGTIAAYGKKGDTFRFYEINPAVVEIARRNFTYLKDTEAVIEMALGDARLNLEREAPHRFDVLAIDAFSSDSIPVHLITLEALAVYEKHMQPDGIVAFHVSNRYLELKPVVEKIATARGLHVAWIKDAIDADSTSSDWILLCKDKRVLQSPELLATTLPIAPQPGWRIWTDDFNNLVQVLK